MEDGKRCDIAWRSTESGETNLYSVAEFKKLYPKHEILSIDGRDVETWCDACGEPLFEESSYEMDEDGVALCIPCADEERADEV